MELQEAANKEVAKITGEKPVTQKMFKYIRNKNDDLGGNVAAGVVFVYHNKNKPPAMPVSSQIALASRKDLLWYNKYRFGDRTTIIPQEVSKMDKNSLAHTTC